MNRSLIAGLLALVPLVLAAQTPAFEVADIKPSDPSVAKAGKGRILPGGRIEVPGYSVKDLMMFAYGVQDNMISGGPKWAGDDRFDIVAKAPTDAPPETLRLMLQTLLADRFRLVMHREEKAMPAYVLTVAKNPPGLQESSGGKFQCEWHPLDGGLRRRECHNLTMAEFVKQLPGWGGIGIDLPVADETGLKGTYDFQIDVGDFPNGGSAVDSSGPTIFAALLKIGLRLESRKMPMPVMVIDEVERPTGN